MRALIWKEARQQLVWLFVALSLATQMWFGMGDVWKQFVLPLGEGFLVFLVWPLVYAFALAQLQFGRDGDERRFGQLVHRGQGARGYFASKVIVGCAAVACVIVLPVTVWALVKSVSDPDANLIRWVRVPHVWLMCVPAFSTYAVGVFSTQLRRGAFVRWGLALCGIFGAFVLYKPLVSLFRSDDPASAPLWAGASNILSALLVLWLARSMLLAGRDHDLALRERHLVGVAVLLFVVALPFTKFLVGTGEALTLNQLRSGAPTLLRDPSAGEFIVAAIVDGAWHKLDVRDGRIAGVTDVRFETNGSYDTLYTYAEGKPDSNGSDAVDYVYSAARFDPNWVREYRDTWKPERWKRSTSTDRGHYPGESGHVQEWKQYIEVAEESGRVELLAAPVGERVAGNVQPIHVQLSRLDRPFSKETGVRMFDGTPLLFDRSDSSLWSVILESGSARLERVAVPDGDTILGMDILVDSAGLEFGVFGGVQGPVFRGQRGIYEWKDQQLHAYQPSARSTEHLIPYTEALQRPATYAVVSEWKDASTDELRIERMADHQTVFAVTYEPRSSAEKSAAAIYSALALLRGSEAVLRERFLGHTTWSGMSSGPSLQEQRLFLHNGHPLLFVLVMLFGAFQLFVGWRWLARSGAGIPTRVVYMLLIATGGVVALLFTRLLLPRRPRPAPAREELRVPSALPARG
jgi:hypothetical protein